MLVHVTSAGSFLAIVAMVFATMLLPAVTVAQQAAETPWVETAQSRVRLVAGSDPSLPGAKVLLFEMTMQPNWKTYWRMPGDAGIPPSFDWTGSTNIGNAEVRYPAPSIYVDQGGTTIGYKTAVTFPVILRPADVTATSQVRLEVAFGICREVCIPAEAKLSLDIPAGAVLPKHALEAAMAKVPVRKDAKAATTGAVAVSSVAVKGGADTPRLVIETAGVETVLIEAPEGLFVPLPKRVAGNGTAATFEADLSKSQDLPDLKGKILTITAIGKTGAIETVWTMPAKL